MKKIAVIGSGISGLTSAYLLNKEHRVELFEAADRLGGHTATVDVDGLAIDTGFIVFNDRTYPRFRYLLRELKVAWSPTQMSFSVSNPQNGLEYNGHNLITLFAQARNLFRPAFYRMLRDIVRFNKAALQALERPQHELDSMSLDAFVASLNMGEWFKTNYLYPMCAAIWSASLDEAAKFPLGFFLRFFANHGLLSINNRPQWAVIKGGSREYIQPMVAALTGRIHLNTAVEQIKRTEEGVIIKLSTGQIKSFDEVVIACHSDQALQLLSDPSAEEQSVLGGIPYQANEVVLHTDTTMLPGSKRAWASWNYHIPQGDAQLTRPSSVTYNMNILQGLKSKQTYCVTLNSTASIDSAAILQRFTYHHPVYSQQSMKARQQRFKICGQRHTHYAGAYWYSGFHEDGVRSAFDIAERFGLAPVVAELEETDHADR